MTAYEILKKRGVSRLCHFTKLSSFTQIITSPFGILSSNSIRQDIKDVTDTERYDGELDYVCCTVEYPNSWFLDRAMTNNPDRIFRDWVVMYIDTHVLNLRKMKFCPCNASKKRGLYICDKEEKLESIYEYAVPEYDYPRSGNMLSCCPTNGQAEILVKDNIPREKIVGVAVGNRDVAGRVVAMLKLYGLDIPVYIAPDVLSKSWSQAARNGRKVAEKLFDGTEE